MDVSSSGGGGVSKITVGSAKKTPPSDIGPALKVKPQGQGGTLGPTGSSSVS